MLIWCSIFCATADRPAILAGMREFLASSGYTPYDPFDIIPGASYPITIKAFAAPVAQVARSAWTRLILSESVPDLKSVLNNIAPTYLLNTGDYTGHDTQPSIETQLNGSVAGINMNDLPPDVQAMAGKIDLKNAGSMASKMLGTLSGRLGASDADAEAAKALLMNRNIDWTSGAGAWLAEQAAFLDLPPNWRTPDFTTLRDAYSVHKRLQWTPKAKLYEGDAEARDAVPDALDYVPIFAGKHT